jgi:DNA-binding transcriptional ArsR family regulator
MVEERDGGLDLVFHALADGSRRRMLHDLAAKDRTIGELAGPFKMSFAGVSKHVKCLERARLIKRTVRGRSHVIHLNPRPIAAAQRFLSFYERLWNDQLDKLETLLQRSKEKR